MDSDLKKRLHSVTEWLRGEYAGIRTGQAAPALLDKIKVESYGSHMSLNQLGSIGIEDARTLRVTPWDAGAISSVETAIREADLGVSVVTDSSGIRVIFPELTSERREQLKKLAKSKLEEARVSVRSARDEVMKTLDREKKEGTKSEDQIFKEKELVQKVVDETNTELEQLLTKKEVEINQ